jgi:hypothetical protein
MTSIEIAIVSILWLVIATLGGLVLALYRAIETAYARHDDPAHGALAVGADMPTLEVLRGAEVAPLSPPGDSAVWIMLFVSSTCDTCRSLLQEVMPQSLAPVPLTVIAVEDTEFPGLRSFSEQNPNVGLETLAEPGDIVTQAKVERVPFAYALHGTTILDGRLTPSLDDIADLAGSVMVSEIGSV